MKLSLITNVYPSPCLPTKGSFNREMVRALSREHEVRVVAPISWTDELRSRLSGRWRVPRDRQICEDGVRVDFPRFWYPPKVARNRYAEFYRRSIWPTLQRKHSDYRPDAVIGYWAHPDGAAALSYARHIGAACVQMVGGSDVLLLTRDERRRHEILAALKGADCVVAVSEHLRDQLLELGVSADRLHVVYRGVDLRRFSPGDKYAARRVLGLDPAARSLLWVGRLVPVKGLEVLVAACRLLHARRRDWTLSLVGDGPLRKELLRTVRVAGLAERVRLVGAVPHAQLADWFRAADAVVLPSHSEGVPNVLLEAHACGTPFVATAVGGVPEIAHPESDLLTPPGDAAALADALQVQLDRPMDSSPPEFEVASLDQSAARLAAIIATTILPSSSAVTVAR